MPFFSNKFSPKKPPSRKNFIHNNTEPPDKLIENDNSVKLDLGNHKITFQNGEWMLDSGSKAAIYKSYKKFRSKIETLEEENNLLRLKIDMLINMLTETTAESHIQQREIEKLKRENTRSK